MGHLGYLKEEYRALVRRLEAGQLALPEPPPGPAWDAWREVLELLCTPEQAELASRMPVAPSSLERVAERLGVPPEELKPRLEILCDRGLVLDLVHPETGRVKYLLAPPVVGFIEFSMMRVHDTIPRKQMAEALEAYTHGDDTFMREVFGGDTVIGRAMVHETALREEVPEVLDWERASALISQARSHAVALCYCRHKAEHLGKACDAPQEVCLSLDGGADFVVRRRFGRAIEKSEAMDLLVAARAKGLVQIADNVLERPTYVCNCCACCCSQLRAINDYQLPAVNPSGFQPRSDPGRCNGCSRCSRACPVTAITMAPRRIEARRKNDLRPVIDTARCIGCGVCADACVKKAMSMVRREARPRVPRNVIERSVRMAVERGRLAQLLFDEGASRGHRFLNQALRALVALPGAKRALATEQAKSRCVRMILSRVKDPTAPRAADQK